MAIGILCGILAGALWGFVFVAPVLVPEISSIPLIISRMLWFGIIALSMAWLRGYRLRQIPKAYWKLAIIFAFTGYTLYFLMLVIGVRLSSPTIASIVEGGLPVTIALCGMIQAGKKLTPKLYLSIGVLLTGIMVINIEEARVGGHHGIDFAIGVGLFVVCLVMWTWYAQRNARFLKEHPTISSNLWGTIVGIATLGSLILFIPLLLTQSYISELSQLNAGQWGKFLLVSFVLGFGSSWLATIFWNQACQRLPLALAGQLIIFETIFGLIYAFLHRQEWPTSTFIIGSVLGIGGILWSLQLIFKNRRKEAREIIEKTLQPEEFKAA